MSFYFILYLFLKCLLNDYLPKSILQDHHFSFYLPAQRLFLLLSLFPSFLFLFFLYVCVSVSVCVLVNSICIINSNSTCQARCSATLAPCSFRFQVISSIHKNGNRYLCSLLCVIHKATDLS